MPLLLQTLSGQLIGIFQNNPQTTQEAAQRWGDAISIYAGINLIPPSTTFEQAKQAFISTLSLLSNEAKNGATIVPNAFTAYAVQLALGMQPVFTGTPPPTPIDFSPVFPVGLAQGSAQEMAQATAVVIDTWFRTGIAVNNASGTTINWS